MWTFPCAPSSPRLPPAGGAGPLPLPAAEAGVFLRRAYLIPQTGDLTSLLKTTVNCIYLLGHNSSLNIHFLILLNHRLNQVSFFLFSLNTDLLGRGPFFSLVFLLCSSADCIPRVESPVIPSPPAFPDTPTRPWPHLFACSGSRLHWSPGPGAGAAGGHWGGGLGLGLGRRTQSHHQPGTC